MDLLETCLLFNEIERENREAMLNCLDARKKHYKKGEFIFHTGQVARTVGIVVSGGVNIIQEDIWGNRAILAHAKQGELFGEAFSCAQSDYLPVSVVATEDTDVLLIDYRKIITVCPSTCTFHAKLIANMLEILANRNIMLTQKMKYLSQRSTRDKLLSFLSAQALFDGDEGGDNKTVNIPFDRQELADYLCVDRSALSRELAKMKQEGILDYKKNEFTLMKQEG